jgi:hypothetical protein
LPWTVLADGRVALREAGREAGFLLKNEKNPTRNPDNFTACGALAE